jgi:polysaccharide export outer membrane protein
MLHVTAATNAAMNLLGSGVRIMSCRGPMRIRHLKGQSVFTLERKLLKEVIVQRKMSFYRLRRWISFAYMAALTTVGAAAAEAPPKALLNYIGSAKELGLDDGAIRQNAIAAGWEQKLVAEALEHIERPAVATGSRMAPPSDYRIGTGDVILVSVWKEPDATQEVTVRSDGRVSLPLIKEVHVGGLTPAEAEKFLTSKFDQMIPGADVTLIVRTINSRKIYVVGAIRNVGPIAMNASLTVLQALAEAGGLTDFAKKKQIYILRHENGKQVRLLFNYEAVIRGEQMDQNILLQPDDTIVVPQ